MSRHEVLDNISHKDIKIITRYSAEFGASVPFVRTFPTEFNDIQREYPILIHKNEEQNEFSFVALTGFEVNENLFLVDDRWDANHVPAMVERGPFLIGFKEKVIDGVATSEPVVHINMDDSRVNTVGGEALFLEHGGSSPYLEKITDKLSIIQEGLVASKAVYEALDKCGLIEAVSFTISLNQQEDYRLDGFNTINQEKLQTLSDEEIISLHRLGALGCAYSMMASLANMKFLISRKNKKIETLEKVNA